MPLQPKVMTKKEVMIARDEAFSTLAKILDLLLRGGAFGYIEFQRGCVAEFEVANENSPSGRCVRMNPEGLKAVFKMCGVLADADDVKAIRLAYSDPVGFILAEPLLSALCPLAHVSPSLRAALLRLLPEEPHVTPSTSSNNTSGSQSTHSEAGALALPSVTLNSTFDMMVQLFAPLSTGDGGGDAEMSVQENNVNVLLQRGYEEAARCFTSEFYPKDCVPGLDVINFLAAVLLTYGGSNTSEAAKALLQRIAALTRALELAPGITSGTLSPNTKNNMSSTAAMPLCMTHTGVRSNRKFERYQNEDRRDEWIRGRDERDARGMYMKHTAGYAGHLPEFQYHFGRTFHVIEENLPLLTKPKAPKAPVAPDAFGPPMVLRNNRMSEHHYRFS